MYAKLENGKLIKAPYYLTINNQKVWNASANDYLSQGWYPVIHTEAPTTEEGYHAESSWAQEGDEIVQTWTVVENEVTADDILDILTGGAE